MAINRGELISSLTEVSSRVKEITISTHPAIKDFQEDLTDTESLREGTSLLLISRNSDKNLFTSGIEFELLSGQYVRPRTNETIRLLTRIYRDGYSKRKFLKRKF